MADLVYDKYSPSFEKFLDTAGLGFKENFTCVTKVCANKIVSQLSAETSKFINSGDYLNLGLTFS